jgi:hypothetical protein
MSKEKLSNLIKGGEEAGVTSTRLTLWIPDKCTIENDRNRGIAQRFFCKITHNQKKSPLNLGSCFYLLTYNETSCFDTTD